jgi:Protein of unknown function (DUF1566)
MSNLCKSVLAVWVIGMGLGVSAPAQGTSAAGPYYATPSWDQTLPATTRFIILTNMGSAAVLDRETGLVWEQAPDSTGRNWEEAQLHCNQNSVGGRLGWRLPTLQDLASLIDPAVAFPGPTLPSGHPFSNVQSSNYWSATTYAANAIGAWTVYFGNGVVSAGGKSDVTILAWCVRGGPGVDPQ